MSFEVINQIALGSADIGGDGSGSGTEAMLVGTITNGGSFPTVRPDGSALVLGDYVVPLATSTFPFSVSDGMGHTCTFNSSRDKAVYLSSSWLVNANPYQNTSETPTTSPSAESISGTAGMQSQVNAEFKAEFDNKVEKSTSTTVTEVYARSVGSETTLPVSNLPSANTLAERYTGGRLKVGTPVDNSDAATKLYVDESKAEVDNTTIEYNTAEKLQVKDAGLTKAKTSTEFWTNNSLTGTTNAENIIVAGDGTIDTLVVNTECDVPEPVSNTNAATKLYVDNNVCLADEVSLTKTSRTISVKDGGVSNVKLAVNSVSTAKIQDEAVNIDKIDTTSIATTIRASATATDEKLTTEKAVRTQLDTKQDVLIASDNITIEADGVTIKSNQIDDTLTTSTTKTYSIDKIKDWVEYMGATFRGVFDTKADLTAYAGTKEPNDRAVVTYDESQGNATTMYRYNITTYAWVYEYTIKYNYDDLTLNLNSTTGKLQIKDGDDTNGITISKLKRMSASDAGKAIIVQTTGYWDLQNIRQYRQVSTFAGESGNNYTFYYLDTPDVIGTISYEKGNYVWDSINGFTLVANVGSGGTSPIYVGLISEGGSFPTTRPNGDVLIAGDYVKPDPNATFPFTIGTVTFTSASDSAIFMSLGNWILNASVYQKTSQTPLNDKTTESIYGSSSTSQYQNQINIENVTEIKKRLLQFSTMPTASADYENKVVQFIGATTASYKQGYMYICVADSSVSPVVFSWQELTYDYEDLTSKPTINGVELTGNKTSYNIDILWQGTQAEYDAIATKNANTLYHITDLGTPTTGTYYTQAEVDTLLSDKQDKVDTTLGTVTKNLIEAVNQIFNDVKVLSGVVKVEVVDTQPSAPVNNTMYYIGTSSPYTVKLYTATKGWTDLGTTEIDLSEYQKSTVSLAEFTATTVEGILVELKTLCDAKVNTSSIVNNVTSTSTTAPLSANMGTWLNNNKQSKITISSSSPSGGSSGDVWLCI